MFNADSGRHLNKLRIDGTQNHNWRSFGVSREEDPIDVRVAPMPPQDNHHNMTGSQELPIKFFRRVVKISV
jgi:hypothetical protein